MVTCFTFADPSPMGYLMQRFPLGKALSTFVIIWGGMVMLLGACNNYWQFSIVRVLLGWFESVVTPGFVSPKSPKITSSDPRPSSPRHGTSVASRLFARACTSP